MTLSIFLFAERTASLKCRNMNIEIVYNLSAMRNISKALEAFGVNGSSSNVIVIVISPTPEKLNSIRNELSGTEVCNIAEKLRSYNNEERVCNYYGISEYELVNSTLLDTIVSRIACRDIL